MKKAMAAVVAAAFAMVLGRPAAAQAMPPASAAVATPAAARGGAPAAAATGGVALADIDKHVNPCVDFYQYACGNWQATHAIPPDQSRWGTFSELQERNREQLRKILETYRPANAGRDPVETRVGDYYAACMDTGRIDRLGAAPLAPELARIAAIRTPQQLAAEVARLQRLGADVLFTFGSDQDFKDSSQVIAEADQGGLGLPERDYYTRSDPDSETLRRQYVAHVTAMLQLAGDGARAADEARRVMTLETALAEASQTTAQRREPANEYHKLNRAAFQALAPEFDWNTYWAGVGAPAFTSLNVTAPDFFRSLGLQLRTVPLSDWRAYLRWHLVHTAAPTLSDAFVKANFAFYSRTLNGTEVLPDRWKRCVNATDRDLGEALGQLYVQAAFGPQAKAKMLAMVGQLQQALASDIRSVAWMDDATRQQALAKLAAFTRQIGYPDKWRDYGSLTISRTDDYGNVQRAAAFEWRRDMNKIGKPVDHGEWEMTPPTVNAYYQPERNQIVFPAGILQPPFYDPNRDPAVNFGAIGVVMGHEMTHGFDDEGSQFDGAGNLRNWWSGTDQRQFDQRAACIANEYSRFSPLPGVYLNGQRTEGENIADNGGARVAYMAMMGALDGTLDRKLDGYTAPQRFFLGFAQVWCENVRPQEARFLANVDVHSPGHFRTDGVVSNMPEFARAFGCGPNDPMTAGANACRVW